MQVKASWESWDEPDRAVAVARWKERDIAVVFPLHWAARHGLVAMIDHAKKRVADVELVSGRTLVPGCVLLAFTRHVAVMPREQEVEREVSRDLRVVHG